ncbi:MULTISPECIES: hypothetical protein [Sulfolobaceae]|uniref:hypothetical protein n=1 Tax=Sulfolobaceae TaxID=118883 RepID=UPI00163D6B88|nr:MULTISPECIES: hypothetical protein [unclassified Sulfolobus]
MTRLALTSYLSGWRTSLPHTTLLFTSWLMLIMSLSLILRMGIIYSLMRVNGEMGC